MKVQVSDKLSCWKCNEPCPIAEEKNGMVSVISKPRFHTPQVHICQQGKSLGISDQQDICPWWNFLSVSSAYGFFNM